jgi:hypothetical protein
VVTKEVNMDRRRFLRVAGGGVVLAAAAGTTGCAEALPPEAVAAWQGPRDTEADVRRWILSYAILAPHSHNLQSWLVDLKTPGEIVLRCDLARLLPQTDPFSRQIMMSHGTFLELLDIAARQRGQRAEITLFPEGEFAADKLDSRAVARIRLQPDAAVRPDPLFAQIVQRRTNRSVYDAARPVPTAAWAAMAEAARADGLSFGQVDAQSASALTQHRAIAAEAWRIELVTPRAMLESLNLMRIGAAEVAQHRDGLTMLDPSVVWLTRLGLFDRSKAPAADSLATTGQIKDFNRKLESTPAFLWMVSQGNDRATQVRAGRAYARVQLAATAHGVAMQPLQQALQEYPEQAGPYGEIRRLLDAPAPSHTVQMWARVGFAPAVPPAPRRGLDAHVI